MLFSAISVAIIATAWFRERPLPPEVEATPASEGAAHLPAPSASPAAKPSAVAQAPDLPEAGALPDAAAASPKSRPQSAAPDPLGGRM